MCFMFHNDKNQGRRDVYTGKSLLPKSAEGIIEVLNWMRKPIFAEDEIHKDEIIIKNEEALFDLVGNIFVDADNVGHRSPIQRALRHLFPDEKKDFFTDVTDRIFKMGKKIYDVCIYANATFLRNSAQTEAGTRQAKQAAAAETLISETIFPELSELPERKLQELIYCGVASANAEQDFCILSNIISTKQLVGRPMFLDPLMYYIRDYIRDFADPHYTHRHAPISPLYMHWVWIQKISAEYLQYYDTPSKVPYTFRRGAVLLAAMKKISKEEKKNAILVAFQPSGSSKLLAEMVECTHDKAYWTGWSTDGLYRTPLSFYGPKRKEWKLSLAVARSLISQYAGARHTLLKHALLKLVVNANGDWVTYETATEEVKEIIRNSGRIQKVSYYKTLRF